MIIILHGENTVKSRDHLVQLTREARADGKEVVQLTASKLTPADLESALQKTSLFGTQQLVVIEELHSLPKSNRKNRLVEIVSQANVDVILWEKRELTKAMLGKFPKAQIKYFKITNSLFAWLDVFSPKTPKPKQLTLLQQAVQTNGEHMCFVMLARQIRLLIQIKDGGTPAGPPFMIAKLKKQAQDFSLEKLLTVHDHLFMMDQAAKTSQSYLSLGQELDLLTANL
jgi:DNA polymerase III delta subunit